MKNLRNYEILILIEENQHKFKMNLNIKIRIFLLANDVFFWVATPGHKHW